MSQSQGCSSLDGTTMHEEPTSPPEVIEESTAIGKDFLETRSSREQEKIERRAALHRGLETCRSWLEALPTREMHHGENHPFPLNYAKIPEPSESMGCEIYGAAQKLGQGEGQTDESQNNASAEEYAMALAWARQCVLQRQQDAPPELPILVGGELLELPTGYAVEFSIGLGGRLIEQRHFVEDIVDSIREDDTSLPVVHDKVKFLAARHSSEHCFVCEKLAA